MTKRRAHAAPSERTRIRRVHKRGEYDPSAMAALQRYRRAGLVEGDDGRDD